MCAVGLCYLKTNTMSLPAGPVSCTDDCEFDIPAVSFADCNPEVNLSQIAKIYLAQPDAANFTDRTQLSEWTARLSATSTDPDAIRTLMVVADKPKPETQSRTISGGRIVVTNKSHVINFDIDETNATNHDFVRGGKCIKSVKFLYETIGGLMFGGNSFIEGTFEVDMSLSRTEGDIVLHQGTLKCTSRDTEERCISPLF